ncbi:MAG: SulP family inorganic anion transporter, partial [Gammaproteobacteria bacterium]|nr:SulP family inorganic anion transporter [Gammaproteobacteria bacterium]
MTRRRDEVWGGLAAMLVALPSAIGFGVVVYAAIDPAAAAQGALYGALGAALIGSVAPLVGGTPALVSAPCAPAAAVLAGLAAALVTEGNAPERIPALLALTAGLAAALQLGFGLLRGGSFIKFIPYPVVSGYLSGVGVIIALGQLPRVLGLPAGYSLLAGLHAPEFWQWPAITVTLITIGMTLLAPRLTRRIPAVILGLLSGVGGYLLLGLWRPELLEVAGNPLLVGEITVDGSITALLQRQLTGLQTLTATDLQRVAYSALALAALLSIDTLKTSVVLDALNHSRHDSNRELLGQGLANFVAAAAGGMAGAGTSGPSLVNISSGGTTRWSGVAEGLFVIGAIAALGHLFAWVPLAALAGILLVVAGRMFDWSAFALLRHRETRLDFAVIAAVVVVAVTVGLIPATGTGVALAILLFIRSQMHGAVLRQRATLRETSSKTRRLAAERELLQRRGDVAAVIDLQGDLFFGTPDRRATDLAPDLKPRQWVLLDLR